MCSLTLGWLLMVFRISSNFIFSFSGFQPGIFIFNVYDTVNEVSNFAMFWRHVSLLFHRCYTSLFGVTFCWQWKKFCLISRNCFICDILWLNFLKRTFVFFDQFLISWLIGYTATVVWVTFRLKSFHHSFSQFGCHVEFIST